MALAVEDTHRPAEVTSGIERSTRLSFWTRRLALGGLIALAVPVVAIVLVALTRSWYPPSDHALIEIRTRDVGGPMTPLLGTYSRLGWNHPGPLLFWVLALPYRLSGSTTQGMLLGATAVNVAAVIGCLILARRRGGLVLTVLVGLFLAAMIRGYGAAFLFRFWNPDLPAFPTAFVVLGTWSVIEGDRRVLPAVVAVSCFTWQAHLGYLPVTGGLMIVAVAAVVVPSARRLRADPSSWRTDRSIVLLGVTAVTAVVCVAPLLAEQAINHPGNLRLIINDFRVSTGDMVGLEHGARVAAKHLAPVGTWLTGDDPAMPLSAAAAGGHPALLVLPVAALIAAAGLARRARADDALRLLALMAVLGLIALVAVTRTTGVPYNYLFNWFRPIATLLWLAVAWSAIRVVQASGWFSEVKRDRLRLGAIAVVAVATASLSVSSLSNGVGLEFQEDSSAIKVRELTPGTLAAVEGYDHIYLRTVGGWCAGEMGHGLALQIIKHGTEVAVVEPLAIAYGRDRVRTDVAPTVELLCGPVAKDAIDRLPIRPVATFGILSDDEERERLERGERIAQRLRDSGFTHLATEVHAIGIPALIRLGYFDGAGIDPGELTRFGDLSERAHGSAVVFFRPFGPNVPH
jgi:hypothetical protein